MGYAPDSRHVWWKFVSIRLRYLSFCRHFADEPFFHPLARPSCFAQKCKAGLHRGIELKTANRNAPSHFAPAVFLHQMVEDFLQGNPVQRITWMRGGGGHKFRRQGGGVVEDAHPRGSGSGATALPAYSNSVAVPLPGHLSQRVWPINKSKYLKNVARVTIGGRSIWFLVFVKC